MKTEISKLEIKLVNGLPNAGHWNPENFWLSQSTMKAHRQWSSGQLCGIVYRDLYLTNKLNSVTGDAAKKGQYFEWLCTAAEPAYGDPVPEPETYKRAGKAANYSYEAGDVKPDWKHPHTQKDHFEKYCKEWGLTLLSAGVRVKRSDADGNPLAGGNLDIIFQVDADKWDQLIGQYHQDDFGKVSPPMKVTPPKREDCKWVDPETGVTHEGCVIIDLKYSGLLEDKWHEAGWHLEQLSAREDTIVQSKHYHWLSGGLPFFFWVFDSKIENNLLIRIFFDDGVIANHVEEVTKTRKVIVSAMKLESPDHPAFTPQPNIKDCNGCPLRADCKHKATKPIVFGIHVEGKPSPSVF